MTDYGITEDGRFALNLICEDGRAVIDRSITGDGRLVYIYLLFSEETGVGTDAISELKAAVLNAEEGTGVEALGSRVFDSFDDGAGVDAVSELLAAMLKSDVGIGVDEWTSLLAAIEESDIGSGVEAESIKVILKYLRVKLYQESGLDLKLSQKWKELNMELTQKELDLGLLQRDKDLNLRLSQRDKDLNLRLYQRGETPN